MILRESIESEKPQFFLFFFWTTKKFLMWFFKFSKKKCLCVFIYTKNPYYEEYLEAVGTYNILMLIIMTYHSYARNTRCQTTTRYQWSPVEACPRPPPKVKTVPFYNFIELAHHYTALHCLTVTNKKGYLYNFISYFTRIKWKYSFF